MVVMFIYVVIILIDPYGLWKQGMKRDFYVSSALCLISFCIAFALAMRWSIPSLSPFLVYWIKKLF
ncbi:MULTISPECIES: hypothetical protein [Paenibacillus]|uniref:hypothetical protein n=1 Tax=Paenibacillus TaxID=44249 RepID=UPI00117FDCCC|nr:MULTISPECIES: hypothetical protein [Paenibacillus]MEC0222349.1 hypothetical protein [Paenibacillus odorifer]